MDFDNLERMIIDNQKSINRLLSAIQTLKEQQDKGDKELKDSLDYLSDSKIKEILKESSEDICLYTIKEGEWYFNNKPTGIKAIGKDGQDGKDGKDGKDGLPGKDGKNGQDGKDGKDGKNGLPGKDGKNGLNGLPGKDGRDGKDVDLRIGKVETVDDKASAKLRKENDIQYLDLKLPRGPQGFMGFDGINGKDGLPGRDGVDGKDGTINGYNNLIIKAGSNVTINQEDNELTINSEGSAPLTGGDNVVIEDNTINAYTNTGYIVSDTDIKLQAISEVEAMAETTENKIVYTDDEVVIIYDGTRYIRRSENGIDFDIIELPYNCKNMIYHTVSKRLIATSHNGYFMYSDDNGKTWASKANSHSTSNTYLFQQNTFSNGFAVINISTKKIITLNEDFSANNTLTSTIVPNYTCLLNSSQFIWCNNIGGFKYGAGAKEDIFPSLAGVSVSLLKNVNDKIIVGLNNNNKLYILSHNTVSGSSWVAYNLPKQCTVNDIIYNPNDSTYYILTSINTYYKTTDFVNFVSVDKDNLRGIQGYFTLAGIQATTTDNNKLLLAPTRIKIENMLQKFKRLTDFDKLLDVGLEKKSEETIGVKVRAPIYVSTSGVSLSGRSVDYNYLTEGIEKILKVSEAPITLLSPTEIEDYVWSNWDGTDNFAFKFMFTEAGTFYNVMSYEEEYTVEKYELGYVYIINNGMTAPYTSIGKFGVFFQ